MPRLFKIEPPPYEYTLAMTRMELHYQKMGLVGLNAFRTANKKTVSPDWNNARLNRLCNMRSCTLYELGHFFLISPAEMRSQYSNNQWLATHCLHFQQHEMYMIQQLTGIDRPVLPPDVFIEDPNEVCMHCGQSMAKRKKRRVA